MATDASVPAAYRIGKQPCPARANADERGMVAGGRRRPSDERTLIRSDEAAANRRGVKAIADSTTAAGFATHPDPEKH